MWRVEQKLEAFLTDSQIYFIWMNVEDVPFDYRKHYNEWTQSDIFHTGVFEHRSWQVPKNKRNVKDSQYRCVDALFEPNNDLEEADELDIAREQCQQGKESKYRHLNQ